MQPSAEVKALSFLPPPLLPPPLCSHYTSTLCGRLLLLGMLRVPLVLRPDKSRLIALKTSGKRSLYVEHWGVGAFSDCLLTVKC